MSNGSNTERVPDAATSSRRHPSLTDVAALAGVSHMTVSRVINDSELVRPATRARVRAAIDSLGYRPNTAARALVTGRTGTLGVVTMDSTLYGPASTLYGIECAAREAGFAITVASVGRPERRAIAEAVETLQRQGVEGIVVIAPHVATAEALQFAPQDIPLVAVGGAAPPVPAVSVNQYDGARLATEHLLSLGHATVWHVAGPADWLEAAERERGWRETLEANGAQVPRLIRGDWSPRSGYEAGLALAKEPDLGAVFVANDQMALGLLRAFTEAGITVPADVHIVGFDDIPEAEFFNPPLTTVRQDFTEVGRRTFALLSAQMSGTGLPTGEQIAAELIVRQSTLPN
ncbi:LacI family DNA-binding transcriptional regulator [Kribbella qitaiheensis]|uniref:LacI family DNA-binding transcriptional regulator n=1 Tax=Kribbella qitaiheensis TaxID=1544730 RepID=A0A7G6X6V9_9ACTN|nr:LacI family DNA-binding transcriptional regulator [Kribbella qitaiheensis]QNE21974.1 LacI family DNA-binding transcriptional regulator [Kribbella qitaiheensis]